MATNIDLAVFIGRFQPFHLGHKHVIFEGLKRADKVAILVGSARSPRSYRNPFTFVERQEMILRSFDSASADRLIILPLEDAAYNDAQWIKNVQAQVDTAAKLSGISDPYISLIGHSKDATSYYLKMFPQWDSLEVRSYKTQDGEIVSATDLRQLYFEDPIAFSEMDQNAIALPVNVDRWLTDFMKTDAFNAIRAEYLFVKDYKRQWETAPYPPTFVTVDAVVVQSGHVLLVRRKASPGKGLWAMPGGFINQSERIRDAVIRELREETKIKVPDAVLSGSIVDQDVFDDPNRSGRGRTITHAFLIKLKDETALPKVKGSDDADKARWVPISQLRPEDFFEDHYFIIQNMLARI